MSKMIPPYISQEEASKSMAEAKIFYWLKNMQWGNAIVLYSQPMNEHISKSFGEIDFVVICEKGIMCIEVKGGRVARENGQWLFINRHGQINKKNEGPYWQAQGNMKSLLKYLREKLKNNDEVQRCRFACCVMTPDCVIDVDDDLEVISQITFNAKNKESDLPSFFEKSFKYWEEKMPHVGNGGLKAKTIKEIANYLRGDLCSMQSLSMRVNSSDENIIKATEEQYEVMEQMSDNDRMFIVGGAGTGKTCLALEQCRKKSIEGLKTLFLCFNSIIADYIKNIVKNDEEVNFDVFTFHELLNKRCGLMTEPCEDVSDYFENVLPQKFLNLENKGQKYDQIVIDEGQDLMNENFICCIDELLEGGVQNGKWTIYCDPNQNIFRTDNEFETVMEELKKVSARFRLTKNFRNTSQIANGNYAVTLLCKPNKSEIEGEDIVYRKYKTSNEAALIVIDQIEKYISEGGQKKDIVILSKYRLNNPKSCLFGVKMPDNIGTLQFNPLYKEISNKRVRYYTISSFKGMESKVVILIDVDGLSDNSDVMLNYVGMSRARSYLVFLYDEKLNKERNERLLKAFM